MSYPDDVSAAGICLMEGCEYRSGGACVRCDSRLRCGCGQFIRADGFEAHYPKCPFMAAVEAEERREAEGRWL